MEIPVVLKLVNKKENPQNFVSYNSHSVLNVKNTHRAVRKAANRYKNSTVIIGGDCKNTILENYNLPYYDFSVESALSVVEKVCRAASQKYDITLPLEDMYLYANPSVAYMFIKKLVGMSRIFTVVTDMPLNEETDSLYFEYGCLIRHTTKNAFSNLKDTLSIFIENCAPVHNVSINITKEMLSGNNLINIGNISVYDDTISEISKDIGCVSGLSLYTLLEKLPKENATVDITKEADRIFLLDTSGF